MIEHKQRYFHKPETGEIGDCWRTCIACILDLPDVHYIPHFYQEFWKPGGNVTQLVDKATNNILRKHYDLMFVEYPVECPSLADLDVYLNYYYPDTYIILGCSSKNGGHSVVRKGSYMWDPAKDNSGCVGPMDDGYYWIGLLVKA